MHRNLAYNIYRNQDISIDCTKCDIFGNMSLSGGGKIPADPFPGSQIPPPADVLTLHPDFNFTGLWVGATYVFLYGQVKASADRSISNLIDSTN